MPQNRVAGARVLFNEQPFSSGRGNAGGKPGRGDEMVFGNLYGAVQHAAQAERASFCRRYKSLLIDESDSQYLRVACDYVHLNPARAGLIGPEERPETYRWSSYPAYLAGAEARPSWLRTDRLLGEHGTEQDNRRGRLEFSRRIENERLAANDAGATGALLRRGWRLGGELFLARILDRLDGKLGENHFAQERIDTTEAKAELIVQMGLKEIGWTEDDLRERKKGAPEKVQIARRLRSETTLSLKRVAQRLNMGSWTSVSKLLYQAN